MQINVEAAEKANSFGKLKEEVLHQFYTSVWETQAKEVCFHSDMIEKLTKKI